MNAKQLMQVIGSAQDDYIAAAVATRDGVSKPKHLSLKRAVLIAAIITLALLLVGCTVVYVLRLQDMSIGQETYIQHFNDEGLAVEPTEKTRDILTLYGHNGDPIQLALTEWYDFLESYDPDGNLMDNNPDHAEIPNQYEYTYSCYTPDMVAKVNEIAEKYNLKLLEEWIPFQSYQSDIFMKESGIGSLVLPDSGAKISNMSGMLYPPYNFDMDFKLDLDNLDSKLWVTVLYARKDYFPRAFPGGMDLSMFEQWDYTAPDGTTLLLALSNKGQGFIIAEPENAMLIYSIDGNFSGSAYPTADEVMTENQLESIARIFDYSIQPCEIDRAAVMQQLKTAQEVYAAQHAYVPETFGNFREYLKHYYGMPYGALYYTFHDMNGDGEKDLLIGQNGSYDVWVTIQDGETKECLQMDTYLCEGNVQEGYSQFEIYETHIYTAPLSETVICDIDAEQEIITVLKKERDQWYQGTDEYMMDEITAEEAHAIMDKYPRIEMDWKPLKEYPLSDKETLLDYWNEKDVRLSDEELREIYKNHLNAQENMHYSHYRILDINSDGVDDLLLKGENDSFIGNTDYYWMALTYRYGQIKNFASDFYLCENGILEHVSSRNNEGVELTGHEFIRYNGLEREALDFTVYNKATDTWQSDWYNTQMDTDVANAILAKYKRIDQGMLPISDLLN